MAVPAVDAIVGDVVRVAELHRLGWSHADARAPGRPSDDGADTKSQQWRSQQSIKRDPGNQVRAAGKELRHRETAAM